MTKNTESEVFTINVVTRLQDNGDGGYTMYVYNNEDELIDDHPLSTQFDSKKKEFVKKKISPKLRKQILEENDPYENGYIGKDTITVKMVDGKMVLDDYLSFSAGQ